MLNLLQEGMGLHLVHEIAHASHIVHRAHGPVIHSLHGFVLRWCRRIVERSLSRSQAGWSQDK